jgi:DNA-binding SARP family transcriptional activator/tetratricopeptide (TPR) repeat protein
MTKDANRVRAFLLGRFELHRAGNVLRAQDWSRSKAAALCRRLLYERHLLKEQAIDFLWPESDLASGANNLYRTLYALRQTLERFLGPGTAGAVFSFEDGVLRLNDSVWVDAAEFERLCRPAPAEAAGTRIARLEQALDLYLGDFLPDARYEEWTLQPRETLVRLRRESSLTVARHYLEQGDFTRVIALLAPVLADDAADEPAQRVLMRAYALSGRRHEAVRHYQACAAALAADLDASPAPETTALYEQILNGNLTPPLETAAPPNWPPPLSAVANADRATPFAGRDAELEALAAILDLACRQKGQAVLLAGETGIGKTHLALQLAGRAAESGMAILFGAAYEQEGPLPFQPFIEAFDHYLSETGRSPAENPITHFQRPGVSDPQQELWALFKATAHFILEISKKSPLLFLVDDLHAADETSLQLFHYLARQTHRAPVLLIATYRTDSAPRKQFNALVNALYREGLSQTITLTALNQDTVRKLLEHALEGEVDRALCRAVHEITAGNPLFIQEIGRALLTMEQVEKSDGRWSLKPGAELNVPADLSALLRQKVSSLGERVEKCLTAAAVLGREFRLEILRDMVGLSANQLLDALDTALDAHLVEERPVGYRFRHPLIRRALYEGLSRARRAHSHTRAAATIEAACAAEPERLASQTEVLAYHYDRSDRREQALPYLVQAGENAAAVYAFEVAVNYFERALALMDTLGLSDGATGWQLLESLGWWHGTILADTPKAVASFEKALALEAEERWQPSSQDVVRLHCGAAVALITAGDMTAAEQHLQAALRKVDRLEDAPEYADLLYNLAQLHWHRNEYREAMAAAQRSLAIAERLDKADAVARAFEMLALACHSLGEWQAGMAYEKQRAELAGAELDVTDAFDVHL